MHWLDTLLSAWRDRQRVAQSRIGVLARLVAHLAAWVFTIVFVVHGLHAPLHAPAPAPIAATAAGDVRFGLPAATRREIFNQITASENEWHTIGTSAFPTEPWSAQDHQAAFERNEIREVASLRHLHLSQVYLVLDEGIREHWPGPGNQPLPATVTPLSPRRQ